LAETHVKTKRAIVPYRIGSRQVQHLNATQKNVQYLLAAAKWRARTRGSNAGVEVAMGVSSSIKIHLILYQ